MPLSLIERAASYATRTAIHDEAGPHTYADLLDASHRAATSLLEEQTDLDEARVAFMVPPGFDYAAVLWGIWRAGGIAVPICLSHPLPEIEYVLDDTEASIIVAHPDFGEKVFPAAEPRGLRLVLTTNALTTAKSDLPDVDPARRAMILYTSGTTSRPKGVVTTHANIAAMITALIEAWGWTENDRILLVLPLHHTHGIVNVLLCALWAGATCEVLPKFDAEAVWHRFAAQPLTLFMAVPTIYARLIAAWEAADEATQQRWSEACRRLRLMVSGSAALPVSVLETWEQISGHRLLERYGMTEIGMALSNPLQGERRPGFVGLPLPGVEIRLVDEHEDSVEGEGQPGEIQVCGPNVFLEYWQRPDATANAFTADGWFRTGDMAMCEDGYYRILGRNSVDIIKTGGEKVSALEIEEVLRTHPAIRECAVVGVADAAWGERVCAAVICTTDAALTLDALRAWAKERLTPYKVPTRLLMLDTLPRNVMGKVTKPAVKQLFEPQNIEQGM
ncbi:MAG TPA: acyl-CoA synthetase [Rhodothermales bacterium]|nr:acyl-CoA synthetase [Rhodothermales bacterium]